MASVRIAGTGLVCCHGRGPEAVRSALRRGREGRAPLSLFALPAQPHPWVNQIDRTPFGDGREALFAMMRRAALDALAAAGVAREALRDTALLIGSSSFHFVNEAEYHHRYRTDSGTEHGPTCSGEVTDRLAAELGVGGPVFAIHTACSSSANALLVGCELLQRGEVERVLVLGCEGLSAVPLGGFASLLLLDPEGCRPFDRDRRGLQLGEGFAALVLERRDGGAGAALVGGANLCDHYHVTSASPDGGAMEAVMREALALAGVEPGAIHGVKAHGTGSADNDAAEAAAMLRLFGAAVPPFTGFKRSLGHTLGACGAVETVALLACLRGGFLPPTLGFATPDPELGVTPLTAPLSAGRGHYLLNFFGFGGNYASLVLRHG